MTRLGCGELQPWADEDSLTSSFPEVAQLALDCRFSDCAHDSEPGCAVTLAVSDGTLAADRLSSWRRLHRELAYLAQGRPAAARADRQR